MRSTACGIIRWGRWALMISYGAVTCLGQTPRQPAAVARLVRQLGDGEFTARDTAGRRLADLRPDSRAELEQALLDDDPEIRLRARALLVECKVDDLFNASRVRCGAQGELASTVLARIAAQSGNRVHVGDAYAPFTDCRLTQETDRGTFWAALDEVCRRSGNHIRPHYDPRAGGMVVCSGAPGKFPLAYAGPLRAQITAARRVFIEELDYQDEASETTHTFQMNLQLTWEERFHLVGCMIQPELIEARTDNGARLIPVQPSAGSWTAVTGGGRQISASLRLSPPPQAARRIEQLRLRWPVMALGDKASLIVPEIIPRQTYSQDDVEVFVESLEREPSGRCELVLVVSRDLALPDPPEIVFQENEVDLFDATGHSYRLQNQTHQLVDRGVQMKLHFAAHSPSSVPVLMRVGYPRVRARKSLEFEFRDVPLPTSHPD